MAGSARVIVSHNITHTHKKSEEQNADDDRQTYDTQSYHIIINIIMDKK